MSLVDDARFGLSASGKGGVGKSTAAIGWALALMRRGLRVGLLDLDVRAPNVTYLLGLPDRCEVLPSGRPVPPRFSPSITVGSPAISVFSPAMFFRQGGALLMNGNTLESIVRDMLIAVEWPALDWLIVDMDPAPGDTLKAVRDLGRSICGIVVTTPDRTSIEDAARMLDAYSNLSVRTLGLFGNMVGLACPKCGEQIMDGGGLEAVQAAARDCGTRLLGQLPWSRSLKRDPVVAVSTEFVLEFDALAEAAVASEA